MYIFDLNKIRSGDIILIRSESRESLLIQQRSNCKYSHAMLYTGESSYIDADGLGVHALNTQRKLFGKSDDAVCLRLRESVYDINLHYAVDYARSLIGTEYSTHEARKSTQSHSQNAEEENRQYCTRLVAQAYQYANIPIVENANYCSPKNILESKTLLQIEDILKLANQREIDYAQETETVIERQTDNTNTILESARNITGHDIQTLEQLTNFVVDNPNFDNQISEIINSSGYLDNWKIEREKNPQHYSLDIFKATYPKSAWAEVGQNILQAALSNLERFTPMLHYYTEAYGVFHLEYCRIHKELYQNLVASTNEMIITGRNAIESSKA